MEKYLIKSGMLMSPVNRFNGEVKDLLIVNGMIASIETVIEDNEATVIDATGYLVTPGIIDIHTHCYPITDLGLSPDILGIQRGATTILDAGTSGAANFEDFKTKYIDTSVTKVFSLLNVSSEGLLHKNELNSLDKIDAAAIRKIVAKYPKHIVGIKARASQSVVGDLGIQPIIIAGEIAQELGLPLMVHVGNFPPTLPEVIDSLKKDDIITHAFHGKKGGILTEDGKIITAAINGRKRGVKFDVGHGSASFNFGVFSKALSNGFDCDFISSDLHTENYRGPVFNMAGVLSKTINCGETLADAISKVTSAPARHFKLDRLGELKVGFIADISILNYEDCSDMVEDSEKNLMQLKKKLTTYITISSHEDHSEIFN